MEVINVSGNVTVNVTLGSEDSSLSPAGPLISLAVPLLMFCTGLVGNVLALGLLWRARGENGRSVFYRLVAALATTDLMGILALSPVTILTYSNNREWVGGQPLCHYYSFMMILAGLTTVLLVLCMAMERCLAILSPYFYERHVTPERVKALLAAVWMTAVVISCLPLVSVGRNVRHYPGTWCFFDFLSERPVDKVFSIVYAVIGLVVIIATAICNVAVMGVLLRMRRVSQNIGKSREGRTLTNMTSEMQMIFFLAGIILVFATCYCPLMVRVLINVSGTVPVNVEADLMAIRLASLNQILDPWVYLLLRRRLASLLYSACRSVSPLTTMSSLRAIRSDVFTNNSLQNSPAATRPRSLLSKFGAAKKNHTSDASLALRPASSPERRLEEYLPLKAGTPEERKNHVGYIALKRDPSEEEKRGDIPRDSPSSACLSDKGSQSSLIVRSGGKCHATLDVVLDDDSDRDVLLMESDSVDGPRSLGTNQAGATAISVSPNSFASPEHDSGLSSISKQTSPQIILNTSLKSEDIQQNCDTNADRNFKTSLPDMQGPYSHPNSANNLSSTDVHGTVDSKHTMKPNCKDSTVPNGTLPEVVQNFSDSNSMLTGSEAMLISSASWPVICRHGNQCVVEVDVGENLENGAVWNKRHSNVESTCTRCRHTTQHPTYV